MQTNNPRKMAFLRALNVEVTDRIPCIVQAQQYSEGYLSVKVSVVEAPLSMCAVHTCSVMALVSDCAGNYAACYAAATQRCHAIRSCRTGSPYGPRPRWQLLSLEPWRRAPATAAGEWQWQRQ